MTIFINEQDAVTNLAGEFIILPVIHNSPYISASKAINELVGDMLLFLTSCVTFPATKPLATVTFTADASTPGALALIDMLVRASVDPAEFVTPRVDAVLVIKAGMVRICPGNWI